MKIIKKARRSYKKAKRTYLKHAEITFFLGFIAIVFFAWDYLVQAFNFIASIF